MLTWLLLAPFWPLLPVPEQDASLYIERIQPLLAQHCLACHGPTKQQGGLRLDSRQAMLEGGDHGPALVPGKSAASLLWRAVLGQGPAGRMPRNRLPLTKEETGLLQRWIDAGAPAPAAGPSRRQVVSDHWSFQPIARPAVPDVRDKKWPRGTIDQFVLARLERLGVRPAPAAPRHTLVRRLSLDLRGLPPTLAELEEVESDPRPDWYERLVDRFLASPHYGEHWARFWMDGARYADSSGFQPDVDQSLWRYRDWLIAAFNRDLPYDRFVTEQLAGDLLPQATVDQKIATGFLRAGPHNLEAGVDPQQALFERQVEWTNTFGTVFLGLTLECAQCHNHKYDPITRREYYQLLAFFAQTRDGVLTFPTTEQERSAAKIQGDISALEKQLQNLRTPPPPPIVDTSAADAAAAADLARWQHYQRSLARFKKRQRRDLYLLGSWALVGIVLWGSCFMAGRLPRRWKYPLATLWCLGLVGGASFGNWWHKPAAPTPGPPYALWCA